METKEILTLVGLAVNAIGLIIALVKFSQEQKKANQLKQKELDAEAEKALIAQKAERRTEYKLRIFQSLIDDCLSFEEIVAKFGEHAPMSSVDQVELRKCIYEMLVEGTLVVFEDRTYTANTEPENDDGDDGDDGEEDEE
jgi:hypothetical protein